jgi:mannose-6-phosphate isomerase
VRLAIANSDNVIRAGLTNKIKDVETLLSTVNYSSGFPDITQGARLSSDSNTWYYPGAPNEFYLLRTILKDMQTEKMSPMQNSSILIVSEGCGIMKKDTGDEIYEIASGQVYHIMPGVAIELISNGEIVECFKSSF